MMHPTWPLRRELSVGTHAVTHILASLWGWARVRAFKPHAVSSRASTCCRPSIQMAWGRPGGVADTPSDEEEDEAGRGIPLPPMRSRREARRGVGVWSPFGQVFNPHGVVELSLGRKPQPATIVHPPASDGAGGAKKFTAAKTSSHVFKESSVTTLPPVFKRGLGLGLGLPRRSSLPPTDAPTGDTPPGTRGRPARKPRPIASLDTALT